MSKSNFFLKVEENDPAFTYVCSWVAKSQRLSNREVLNSQKVQDFLEGFKKTLKKGEVPNVDELASQTGVNLKNIQEVCLQLLEDLRQERPEKKQLPTEILFKYKFDQLELINDIDSKQHPRVSKINKKHSGICDLLCNLITAEDLLGKGKLVGLTDTNNKAVRLQELETTWAKTHIIERAYFIQKLLAVFFHIYPNSILNRKDSQKILQKRSLDKDILFAALDNVPAGDTIKFCAFTKTKFSLAEGHSMLIKKYEPKPGKNPDKIFKFFDPNFGVTQKLTKEELYVRLTYFLELNPGFNAVCFMNNTKFLEKIVKTNIKQNLVSGKSEEPPRSKL